MIVILPLLSLANAREVDGCFFHAIDLDKIIHPVIKEGAHGADAEAGCRPREIQVLPNVTGIHIDVPVGPLPVLPCAPRNNGRPYERRPGVFGDALEVLKCRLIYS